jgi:energy-coupling factor transport system ATP-binding protein
MAYFEVDQISYGVRGRNIFNHVSCQLNQAEFVSLVGSNGIGKTTLAKLMMGILTPEAGQIRLDGKPMSKLALYEVGRKIGYLFQNPTSQIFCATIQEELLFAQRFQGGETPEGEARAEEMIDVFSLHEAKDSPVHALSHGEKQRLALATIMMSQPEYLILDEPTTGLDQVRKAELGKYLKEIHQSGVGILMISHDHGFVKEMSQRILRMDEEGLHEENLL